MRRNHTRILAVCGALFALRVIGQLLVAVHEVDFLPPFDEWQSGLLPYPVLVASQIVILGTMGKIVRDIGRNNGYFATLSARTSTILRSLAIVYAVAMAVRYALTMAYHPDLRWFTGTIPIWFHLVLATFLYTLGHYQLKRDASRGTFAIDAPRT